jgi:hypothetical protein
MSLEFNAEQVFAALNTVAPSHFSIHGWNARPETREVMRRHRLAYRHVQSQYNTFVANTTTLRETLKEARAYIRPSYSYTDYLAVSARIEAIPLMQRNSRRMRRIPSELSVGEWVVNYREPAHTLPFVCDELNLIADAHIRAIVNADNILTDAEKAIWTLERWFV